MAGRRVNMVPVGAVRGLDDLISRFESMREALGLHAGGKHHDDSGLSSLYRLPWESASKSAAWPQSMMTTFLLCSLGAHGITAPDGHEYTYHSIRHGSATDAHSIGVPERKNPHYGQLVRRYVKRWPRRRRRLH